MPGPPSTQQDVGARLVVAVDVAKVGMVAAIAADDGRVLNTIGWKAPRENTAFLELLRQFRTAGLVVEVAMEFSGTYGDVLQHQLDQEGLPVFMVSGKRTGVSLTPQGPASFRHSSVQVT